MQTQFSPKIRLWTSCFKCSHVRKVGCSSAVRGSFIVVVTTCSRTSYEPGRTRLSKQEATNDGDPAGSCPGATFSAAPLLLWATHITLCAALVAITGSVSAQEHFFIAKQVYIIHTEDNSWSPGVGRLEIGDSARVIETAADNEWIKVDNDGALGWVY